MSVSVVPVTKAVRPRPSGTLVGKKALPFPAVLTVATLAIWTQAQPFADFRAYNAYAAGGSSDARVIATLAIAVICVLTLAVVGRLGEVRKFVSADLLALLGFFFLACVWSQYPGLALNRLALAALILFIAWSYVGILRRPDALLTLLAGSAAAAVGLSLMGVAILPDLSIHSLAYTSEPGLAGNWRGIFAHKNDLAAMCAYFIFLALYLMQTARRGLGLALLLASAFLLFMSAGKSAQVLLVATLAVSTFAVRGASRTGTIVLIAATMGGLAAITVGVLVAPPIADFVRGLLPDASYTGRTEIWSLAFEAIARSPWFGYGYNVFWDTRQSLLVGGWDSFAALAAHAHNGYLETAISAGLPGLTLTLVFAFVLPVRDILRIKQRPLNRRNTAALTCLVQFWLFTLLLSGFEAVLFNRGNAMWFCGLLSIFMLRAWRPDGAEFLKRG